MEFVSITPTTMMDEMAERGLACPLEQSESWAQLEATIPGRTPWGTFRIVRDGETLAYISLIDYQTHGYHFLRSFHGPVWVNEPGADDEALMLDALRACVHQRDRKLVFARLGVRAQLPGCHPTLSTSPYDQTVVMDLTGTEEDIITRMKKRGRRDVRKALRESPATYADETERATESFDEYFALMAQTGERDGFTPAPQENYENMLRILGPEHCRLYAGRIDGKLVTWSIDAYQGTHGVHYYAASDENAPMRNLLSDGLVYYVACELARRGVKTFDLMGIGSDEFPALKTLNTFKTKFSNEITKVAPDRDYAFRPVFYASLAKARELLKGKKD